MKRVRFLNRVATNGFTEQVTLEPTPGGSRRRETFGHQMEGLSRQREQQVQSQGEAVWGVPVEQRAAQCVWWGLGCEVEANQAAPRKHLGDKCLTSPPY